jgi:hydroxymethylpyrimidine/phosphomethylpyrimidine kinase
VHGGGCALASLIAGRLARGESMLDAVEWAKRKHHDALADAIDVGGDMRVVVF